MLGCEQDKGYAWVILACCSFSYFALFGLFRSSGVLYVALLQSFGTTREEASWPFSICSAVNPLAGLLASVLTQFSTIRKVTLLGCAIATAGLALCYWVSDIFWVEICYGFIHGLGVGTAINDIPALLGQYFCRYRTTAIGIALSGSSLSAFIFPRAVEYLLDTYGLQGTFLLLAGIVAQTIVASALLKDPPWNTSKVLHPNERRSKESGMSLVAKRAENNNVCDIAGSSAAVHRQRSESDDESFLQVSPVVQQRTPSCLNSSWRANAVTPTDHVSISIANKIVSDPSSAGDTQCGQNYCSVSVVHDCESQSSEKEIALLLTNGLTSVTVPTDHQAAFTTARTSRRNRQLLVEIVEKIGYLLRQPVFYVISFSSSMFVMDTLSFFITIVDYAIDKEVPEGEAIYILAVYSALDITGRSGLGWLADNNFVKRKTLLIVNRTIVCVLYMLYPVANTFAVFCCIAIFHGIFSGGTYALLYTLMSDYLGTDRLVLVIGLCSFINGLVSFLRPPIIGLFRDVIGSYDWMFRTMGVASLATAVLWLLEPCFVKNERSQEDGVSLQNQETKTSVHSTDVKRNRH